MSMGKRCRRGLCTVRVRYERPVPSMSTAGRPVGPKGPKRDGNGAERAKCSAYRAISAPALPARVPSHFVRLVLVDIDRGGCYRGFVEKDVPDCPPSTNHDIFRRALASWPWRLRRYCQHRHRSDKVRRLIRVH